jgi:hypothetical protein
MDEPNLDIYGHEPIPWSRALEQLATNPNFAVSVSLDDIDGPWDLYAVIPTAAVGVATKEPHGATRWRFHR